MRVSRLAALAAICLLCACTRPLAPAEEGFARALFGETLDTDRIGIAAGAGLMPPPREMPRMTFRRLDVPETPCARTEPTPVTGPPAALVSFNRIHYFGRFRTADAMAGWPERARMPHALLLAHELTHVWQWQNRAVTGYHPFRAFLESLRAPDPYFYRVDPGRPFLDYGYEQQAALVEDYVCHRLLDPEAPKMQALRTILGPVFPLERLDAAIAR